MNIKTIECKKQKNINDNKRGSKGIQAISAAVGFGVLTLLAWNLDIKSSKTQCKTAKNSIACMDFSGEEIKVRTNKMQWKQYINSTLDILAE